MPHKLVSLIVYGYKYRSYLIFIPILNLYYKYIKYINQIPAPL